MIEAGKSEVVSAAEELRDTWRSDCIFSSDLMRQFPMGTDGTAIRFAMHEIGARKHPKRKRINGDIEKVWALRNVETWVAKPVEAWAREAQRGRA